VDHTAKLEHLMATRLLKFVEWEVLALN